MAKLISSATGNFTASGTWKLVDSTSTLDSEAANTALTTSYVTSSTFTPGAITIDGIAVKIASVSTSPSGTISVALDQGGGTVSGTEVTLNVSDMPYCSTTNLQGGWVLFKFASPVTLAAATAYSVKAKTSAASQVNLFRDATANNWARLLRTTTNQAPAAGDDLYIMGEHTGAGTGNNFTVTMNNTATTDFGSASTSLTTPALAICKRGTLTWGTAASTAYYLKISGNFIIYSEGTVNIGTTGTPLPSTSTAELVFDCAGTVDFGLTVRNGGTLNIQGASKATVKTLLTADAAAAATVITIASTSGWAANDELAFATTTRTASQCEKKIISTVDSATQVTLTAGLTNAHSGTSPTQAEAGNLTRNIKIHGATSSLTAFIDIKAAALIDIDYAEFYWLGSGTANKRGLDIATATGAESGLFNMQYSSLHDCTVSSAAVCNISGSTANSITISNNVVYLINTYHLQMGTATSGTSITVDNNLFMLNSSGTMVALFDCGLTFTNNTLVGGASNAITLSENNPATFGTFNNITVHGNAGGTGAFGITAAITHATGITISNLTIWRNNSYGIVTSGGAINLTIDTATLFGNNNGNIELSTGTIQNLKFKNITLNGDTTFSTPNGMSCSNAGLVVKNEIYFINCDFSTVSGIKTAHTAADISLPASPAGFFRIYLFNTKLDAATEVTNNANLYLGGFVTSQRHDQTAGNHKAWFKYGKIEIDNSVYNTAAPSELLTPNNASGKLESAPKAAAVDNGKTLTVSVYVRKNASYTGSQPRLIVKENVAAGITADTVLDTMTAGTGTWEQLTGTTAAVTDDAILEFVVDCDGTAGAINVDDWSVT